MIVLTVSITMFLSYLIYERLAVNRWRRSIPLVVTVTGTRGKSSVTRLLAAVLREDGREVVAKTTGAEPKLLWPDGTETEIRRRGPASIIEQKSLLRNAALGNVDCVVAEVMSIHPENHIVESQQILKPDIVAFTNVWPDHVDALGGTETETARCLSLDIPEKATVFAPAVLCEGVLAATASDVGGRLISVPLGQAARALESLPKLAGEFEANLDLVWSLARHIGVEDEVIRRGLVSARQDAGALKVWKWTPDQHERSCFAVNGFAANDPESTSRVLDKVRTLIPLKEKQLVGMLCLRADRGDRTEQWIEALENGLAQKLDRLYVYGGHAKVVARRLDSVTVLTSRSPGQLMETIVAENEDGSVVFGFGNFVGMGRQLVDYWNSMGVVHGV